MSNGDTLPDPLTDLTLTGNDGTRVDTPKFLALATPAGNPAFSPQASGGGYYTLPTGMWSGKTAGHIFAYAKAPAGGVGGSGPWQMGGNDMTFYPYASASDCYEGALTNTRYAFTASLALRSVWRVYEVESNGTTHIVRIDGVAQATNTVGFTAPTSGRVLASTFGPCDFPVAEIVAYPAALSSGDAGSVRSYLTTKHGATG